MQDSSAFKLFREQARYYSRRDQSAGFSPIIPLFLNWVKKNKFNKPIVVAEFGGAAGQLLNQISKVYFKATFINIEFIDDYKNKQVSNKIKFIQGSILNSGIVSKSFNCIIIRDVLHHLVGKNYLDSLNNQKKALEELKRLIKPGGAIFIEELINESVYAAKIIYYLSKLNSIIGIRSKPLQITPYTVLAFLTPHNLTIICQEIFGKDSIISQEFQISNNNWKTRLVHLGFRSGKLILVIAN